MDNHAAVLALAAFLAALLTGMIIDAVRNKSELLLNVTMATIAGVLIYLFNM